MDNKKNIQTNDKSNAVQNSNSNKTVIILISILCACVLGLGAYIIIAKPFTKTTLTEDQVVAYYKEIANPKNAVAEIDNETLPMYEYILTGDYVATTTNTKANAPKFTFTEDKMYKGYSSRENNDIGTWSLSAEGGEIALITSFPTVNDRYVLSFNDDEDIVLTDAEDYVYVLKPAESFANN